MVPGHILDALYSDILSMEIARQIAPYVDGYYLITPFGRTGLVVRIMDTIRTAGLA